MKNLLMSLVLLPQLLFAAELAVNDPVFGHADESLRLKVVQTIEPLAAGKQIYLQDNQVKQQSQISSEKIYCIFENVRTADDSEKVAIPAGQLYKLSQDFGEGWERFIPFRLWQRQLFFWDNGYYQSFDCYALDARETINYGRLKQHIGKFLQIHHED